MKYRRVIVTQRGGPESFQISEQELREPHPGEARIKVLATPVCAPDVSARRGRSPFLPKLPFTPGYAIIGEVEALGPRKPGKGKASTAFSVGDRVGALTTYGGYSEYIYLKEDLLFPVPARLSPGDAVPLILDYIVAYHCLHWWARVKAGQKILIIGASGGIGTAFLQLGKLAGLSMYGLASKSKHGVLAEYGAVMIDYRSQDFVEVLRQAEPEGLDAVFDGMAGGYFRRGFSVLRRGGTLVGYGNPESMANLARILGQLVLFNLLPNGKTAKYYSTGVSFANRQKYLDDWATLFRFLGEGRIKPVIEKRFPILEAAQANALLESGQATGNIVLLAPELM